MTDAQIEAVATDEELERVRYVAYADTYMANKHIMEGDRHRLAAAAGIRAVRERLAGAVPELPEWVEHVEISIGAYYHEWQEGGKKHWHWRRSCWGEGSTLANAIDNMMSKSCVTQESWDSRVRMNPHLAIRDAVGEAEGDDAQ